MRDRERTHGTSIHKGHINRQPKSLREDQHLLNDNVH